MPTYENPVTDAAEAYEALRGLAHATRSWEEPADTYRVIGEVVAGIRCLGQVLDQLAGVHLRHQDGVSTDDGDRKAGAVAALAAADGFHQAAVLLDQAHDQVSAAFSQSGKIVWHPQPATTERWVSVVFLQGDEADRPLRILRELGHVDAVDYLAQWDYGDETTDAAMENGYVYDEPGEGTNDQVAISGEYALVVNPHIGYVSLLRRHTTTPEPEAAEGPGPVQGGPELLVSYSSPNAPKPAVAPRQAQGSWFEPAAITTRKQSGRLSL
ncbi:MAG: hypothetical protein U0R23_05160 [Candidatus Nanopelagicales bacterium]